MHIPLLAAGPADDLARAMRDAAESSYSYAFQFDRFLIGLMWAVWVVLNLWIWKKTKASANMLMLCGSAALGLFYLIHAFTWRGPGYWLVAVGTGVLSAGFFLSVKPLVEAQLNALKAKMHAVTHKSGGSEPPKT